MLPQAFSARRSALRLRAVLFAALFLVSGFALAGKLFSLALSHTTKKTPDEVLSVLVAYKDVCHKGCKYDGPDVVEFVQLPYKKTPTSWYTWTYVSTTMKDVRYFSKVTLQKTEKGFTLVTRQLDEKDEALVRELEEKAKKKHEPAFDSGKTIFTVASDDSGKTKVTQAMSMTASGMLAMFGAQIEDGMRTGAKVTFKNIEK